MPRDYGHIIVIGAGISGLSAAHRLAEQGADVTVLEATGRVGGVIRSERSSGFLVEHGPNSTQSRAELSRLLSALGLDREILLASESHRNRFVVRDERLKPLPLGPGSLMRSTLFSFGAKLRLLREPFIQPGTEAGSVADFVRRRLGSEFLDYAINPFVAGIFAGDPESLSMKHAFPRMLAIEQEHGSLIRGLLARAPTRKGEPLPVSGKVPFSFMNGMEVLPGALATYLGERMKLNAPVQTLDREVSGWRVTTDDEVLQCDAVILSIPFHRSRKLLRDPLVRPLREIEYVPVTVVAHGFRIDDIRHPLDGFGVLVPAAEKRFRILGALFSSTLFPNRAPDGHALVTTFLGGKRHSGASYLGSDEATEVALEDLTSLLGIRGRPVFSTVVAHRRAIPQYDLGYGDILDGLARLESSLPGLFFTGNYCRGVSVGDTVTHAVRRADDALAYLHRNRREA